MNEKTTDELKKILGSTRIDNIQEFISAQKDSIVHTDRPFCEYVKGLIKEKGLKLQEVFLEADIPERYGYKLLTEEKRTRQRDVILRICYGAKMTLDETQTALRLYQMPELYPKFPRDALIMIAFNERPGTILDVNAYLRKNNMDALRSSGVQE